MNAPSASSPLQSPASAPVAQQQGGSESSGKLPDKAFTPLVRQFLEYLRLEKHFSDYTVKSYGADLIQFGHFLGGEIGPAANVPGRATYSPGQVDERTVKCEPLTIREFLSYLYGQNYTKST